MDREPASPDAEDALDVALMLRTAADDEAAFRQLIQRHQTPLLNLFRRLGALQDADDLAQETFLRVYRYRMRYRNTAKFRTFLYTLARHAWADGLRKLRQRERLAEALPGQTPEQDDRAMAVAGRRLDAEVALAELSEKLRLVVVMSVYQGLRYEEIAAALDIPVGTVKSRMFMALQELKSVFDERTG